MLAGFLGLTWSYMGIQVARRPMLMRLQTRTNKASVAFKNHTAIGLSLRCWIQRAPAYAEPFLSFHRCLVVLFPQIQIVLQMLLGGRHEATKYTHASLTEPYHPCHPHCRYSLYDLFTAVQSCVV